MEGVHSQIIPKIIRLPKPDSNQPVFNQSYNNVHGVFRYRIFSKEYYLATNVVPGN